MTEQQTESSHLRNKLKEATLALNTLENASEKVVNDVQLYIKLLQDYSLEESLKQRLILQLETLRLPLERALKEADQIK